ncbi:Serine-rich adhesin for platelets like [Quillaja saponaria]|uniref:Serine-rich adhesin for platelets like n=1 Tax=Quillaja saponaria TaxID=32244 RepID=A0AAD7Q5R3_QUISA|nr:Serine-rich adhesin for platelets like [Quillaja saponaria]KAJ7975372.1 Serine-rich adhesin for platelets like [Quillaja saponaria]
MHCALQKVGTDSKKVADVVNNYLPRKSEEQNNSRTSFEADCKVSSLARRNSDSRCVILTFLESDGNWRIVALPLQCLSNCNFASGVNMDGLQLVFPPPINALVFDQHKGQRVMPPDCAYAINSFTRSISEANGRRQSQNKTLAYRASKLNGLSGSSSQRLLTCNNILAMNPDGSTAVDSSDMFNDNCKVRKSVKKNSRRKTKRKGRQSQKLSRDTGPTEPEVLSEEYTHWSSNSETCGNNDVDQGVVSYLTRPEIPLTDDSLTKSNFDSNKDDGIFGSVEALKYCTSCVDNVEKSEAIAPAVHNSVGEPTLSNSEDHLRTINPEFSLTAGGVEDIHNKQHFKDMCSKSSSDMQDSLVLDSVSVGSNSDDNTNAGEDVKQSEKISCGIGLSENLLNGVSNAKHTDGTKHGAHSSRSSNKRGKQNKVAPRNASVNRSAVVGNSHGRTGKENNHSVWQKVKRNEFDECGAELKKVSSTFSQIDATSKMAPSLKRNCNFVDVNILSRTEDKKHLKSKVGRKMKRRASTGPKQEYNCNSRRGPHSNQAIANQHPGISMKQNEISYIMSHASGQKGDNSALGSHNHNNSVNRLLTTSVECESSESVHSARVYADESKPPRSVCCSVSSENMENEDSSLPKSCGSFDQAMTEEQSPLCVTYLLGDEIDQIQREAPFIDYKQSHNSGSTLQKWIPIGVKDSGSTISNKPISSSLEHCDEITAEDWTLKSSNEGKTVSNFQNLVSSVNSKVTSTGNELQNQRSWNQDASTLKEQRDKYTSPNCCINECTIEDPFLNYSNKIAQAVNDSCRAQLACEAVQMVTGCPIAEFERILHFCSPVICQSPKLQNCLICSRDCTDGVPLCRHETPNISLGCLWEWYEKHGSYGLEIRAEDYENPKRLGVDRFRISCLFCPFFVSNSAVRYTEESFPT